MEGSVDVLKNASSLFVCDNILYGIQKLFMTNKAIRSPNNIRIPFKYKLY
jgi:hypothetical protein